ncbi:hypothetical protein FRUB_08684 [Fimbriiglobus ruber]|uniref:VWFA domain-containing protein n=1 Tax=Fimbriiglobus ruber TaxID=1908690 RepID=A0A225D3F1_9BACT|nr:hypothetical protein FRUB_08684 [Fimbriiglobus ruber]
MIVGAALVGLPILLHLIMKQEPKRLLFPALRFLKQKQRTNQRKMRLRHLILLALRMLLIALFAVTLFQPKIPSSGLSLAGEQPVAAVLIVDTTPSMGYKADNKSRLDEARRRALELLDDLPPGSRVAVLDPADPTGTWEQSAGDARRKIEGMKEPHGGGPPVTAALFTAYQLFRTIDRESDGAEAMPRLVAVFSDRTAECWQADRADDLKKAAADLAPLAGNQSVAHLFVDVGVDRPVNVGITSAQVSPQLANANQPVSLIVTVQATGPDVPTAVLRVSLDDGPPERKAVDNLPAGTPRAVTMTFKDLKPGVHAVKATLETDDALLFDNVRYATFRVGAARKILTLSDDPDDALFWQLAHEAKGEFGCDVAKPDADIDFGPYEFVCLLNVADPSRPLPARQGAGAGALQRTLWDKLAGYVKRGGKVLVIPGPREKVAPAAYDPTVANDPTSGLLPGKLVQVIDTNTFPAPEPPAAGQPPPVDRRAGVTWATKPDDRPERHPLTAPFKQWNLLGNVDFLMNPRKAWKYWEVKPVEDKDVSVVVAYDDADDPTKRHPAVLERTFPGGGKVLLLTTRMDDPEYDQRWNNYWLTGGSSWPVVFPHLLASYLAGNAADAVYNFTTGRPVAIALPKSSPGGAAGQGRKLVFEGPGVSGPEAYPEVGDRQADLRLSAARTLTPGNYLLRTEDRSWQEGFSLNPPAEESNLSKVPVEVIEAVFGANSVIPIDKNLKLHDVMETKFNPEMKLFPWLLIGVLFLFALEGFVANRFYRFRAKS